MHIDSASTTINGKTYTRHLLRETYRENGKVKHRTLLNLKNCSDAEIAALKLALPRKAKNRRQTQEGGISTKTTLQKNRKKR
jgi:hypothetical protein